MPFCEQDTWTGFRASEDGYNIVIVGDENHPEVQGIKGWCKGEAMVIDSIESRENHRRQPLHRMPDYYKKKNFYIPS